MDGEMILFGFIPALASAALIVCSFLLFVGYSKSLLNCILLLVISFPNGFAQVMFMKMFGGAYASFLPHLIILVTLPVFLWQYKRYKKYWPERNR